jgi:hypothetical protein
MPAQRALERISGAATGGSGAFTGASACSSAFHLLPVRQFDDDTRGRCSRSRTPDSLGGLDPGDGLSVAASLTFSGK